MAYFKLKGIKTPHHLLILAKHVAILDTHYRSYHADKEEQKKRMKSKK